MSNSNLATYIDKGTGRYNTRSGSISKITIHQACCVGDCEDLSAMINASSEASYNYGIGNNGNIALFVDERFRSWSTGNPANDDAAVNIIVANSSLSPTYAISQKAYSSLIRLVVDICRRNFITKLTYTGSPSTSNLTIHKWFRSGVNCPGPYIEGKLRSICDAVNSQLNSAVIATSLSEADKASSMIVASAINPYVVTVTKQVKDVDYTTLRLSGVVGAMLECGKLYNTNKQGHSELASYTYPNLAYQVAQADSAGIPFGLVWECNARTEQEAKNECYYLYFILSKYPPKLGAWIHIDFLSSDKAVNDKILDIYYDKMFDWGLHDKCGIYCNKAQLTKITWSRYSSKMSLWVIDKLSSMSSLPDLLTPQFFK